MKKAVVSPAQAVHLDLQPNLRGRAIDLGAGLGLTCLVLMRSNGRGKGKNTTSSHVVYVWGASGDYAHLNPKGGCKILLEAQIDMGKVLT